MKQFFVRGAVAAAMLMSCSAQSTPIPLADWDASPVTEGDKLFTLTEVIGFDQDTTQVEITSDSNGHHVVFSNQSGFLVSSTDYTASTTIHISYTIEILPGFVDEFRIGNIELGAGFAVNGSELTVNKQITDQDNPQIFDELLTLGSDGTTSVNCNDPDTCRTFLVDDFVEIELLDGQITQLVTMTNGFEQVAAPPPNHDPAPSTIAVFTLGLATLGFAIRRRNTIR